MATWTRYLTIATLSVVLAGCGGVNEAKPIGRTKAVAFGVVGYSDECVGTRNTAACRQQEGREATAKFDRAAKSIAREFKSHRCPAGELPVITVLSSTVRWG